MEVYGCDERRHGSVEVTEENAEYMTEMRCKIPCGDPCREKPKEEEEEDHCLPSAL